MSTKIAKGTIKINEDDSRELRLEIIDNVTITHKKSGNVFTAMSYSSSKIPRGTIYMSIPDAKVIGYKEGDKVFVEKAERKTKEFLPMFFLQSLHLD